MSNNQVVFSRSVCLQLINKGFECIDIQIGIRDKKPVYYFDITDDFTKAFDEIVYSRQAIQLKFIIANLK